MIGVKLRTNVCNTNIHLPFCEVGENLQRPFEISWIEEDEAEKVLVPTVPETERKLMIRFYKWIHSKNFEARIKVIHPKYSKHWPYRLCVPKDWGPQKVTIYFLIFYLVKSSENILFFYLHFTWLCGSWNHQRFLKK